MSWPRPPRIGEPSTTPRSPVTTGQWYNLSRMRLLAATSNRGKVRELARALAGLGFDVVDLEAAGAASLVAPEETGATFAENALLKAGYYHEATGLLTVADDSGLEVDVLG